jgi:uncharacterized membrane protein YsdA (DUF1294 family)
MSGPSLFSSLLTPQNITVAFIAVNFFAFTSFWLDKRQAQMGARRTRESTLLWMAFLGGTPGAYCGRRLFRHKTRKQPFSNNLHTIALLQISAIGGWIGWQFAG